MESRGVEVDYCFWRVSGMPREIGLDVSEKVMFTDGERVFAEGVITDVEEGEIQFMPLERVDYPQPKKAPSRGFTYVRRK